MGPRNSYAGFDEYAVRVLRHNASVLVRKGGLQEADRDDLEQELALDLLRRLSKFDPARATRRTFVARVVAHRAASLVAACWSAKSAARRASLSLDDEVADGEDGRVLRGATLDEDAARRRTGAAAREHDDEFRDLRLDIDALLPRLAPEMTALCAALREDRLTATARATATPRSTLWSRTLRIRERFVAAGIDAYLPATGVSPNAPVCIEGEARHGQEGRDARRA